MNDDFLIWQRQLERERQARKSAEQLLEHKSQELYQANQQLHGEIAERAAVELAVQHRNAELEALNRQLRGGQMQLLHAEKMASIVQLAAGMAHEINNPISFVHSNLGSLQRYLRDVFDLLLVYEQLEASLAEENTHRQRLQAFKAAIALDYLQADAFNLLKESLDGVDRVAKIVSELRALSHPDEGQWHLADIHQELDNAIDIVWCEDKTKVDLVREYGELPLIECLPLRLKQVFRRILVNATQAIEQSGMVKIRTGCDASVAWVRFSDTGKGIEQSHLSRIFDPFFTTKPIGAGMGLGLSVCYGIIQEHGGAIEVASEIDQGTHVTIRLPVNGRKRNDGAGTAPGGCIKTSLVA